MTQTLVAAACQFPVSCDISRNARFIQHFMRKASETGADIVHFPETALPGYSRLDFKSSDKDNWNLLQRYTEETVDLAGELGLWVVVGSCQKIVKSDKPSNCVHIVSNAGRIVGTYAKRNLFGKETLSYTAGKKPLVVSINGFRCGFLICFDACFPVLYDAYRIKGVQIIFHSCYNVSRKPKPTRLKEISLAQLRTRAMDNQMWISSSNSSAKYSFSTACMARPDGSIQSLKPHAAGILLHHFPDTLLGWTYDNRKKPLRNNHGK